jgi:hypothetical protein
MSALPKMEQRCELPWWPGPLSKLQASQALKLEPTPGCGRLDRSDFASWTPEGRDVLARILRAVIERNVDPRKAGAQ